MSDCLFCRIASKELPSEVVAESDEWIAFRDIHPLAPTHVLIVPKKHFGSLEDFTEQHVELAGKMLLAAKKIAGAEGISRSGYRIVVNNGPDGAQVVQHLHLHLLGGRRMGSKMG